jgi:hypothetical protein
MKLCGRCHIPKELTSFSKNSKTKDGLKCYCKACASVEHKEYNKKNREKCREKLKKWREKNPGKDKEYSQNYIKKNKEKIISRRKSPEAREKMRILVKNWNEANVVRKRENEKIWKSKNRQRVNAIGLVAKHLRRGKMIRSDKCEVCGIQCKTEGHHADYTKPTEVKWLCFLCHKQKHGKLMDVKPSYL